MVVRLDLLAHIVILVFQHESRRTSAVAFIDEFRHLGHHILAVLETDPVVVADDVSEVGLLDASLEGNQVEEAFIALGVFRTGEGREQGVEFLADQDSVAHLSLGVAGVHVAALDVDLGGGRIEILEFQFADFAAVHRVGIFRPETFHVEFDDAAADFFVRGETDLDVTVLEFGMLHDVLHGVHDLSDASLVVRAEQGRAVGGDERLADVVQHFREFFRLQLQAWDAFQVDGATVVVFDDLGLDILAGGVRRGIDVGDETHSRDFLVDIGGDGGHYVAEFVKGRIDPHRDQFVAQQAQQVEFLGRRGLGLGLFVGLGIDGDVAEESVQNLFHSSISFLFSSKHRWCRQSAGCKG